MLRSIFPDEPIGDQNAASDTDNPGTFFAEFLPTKLKANGSSSRQAAADAAAAAKASALEATAAARTAAVHAAQQAAAAAAIDVDQQQKDLVQAAESPFDLPSLCEIRSAVSTALFGTSSEDAQPSTAADGTQGHKYAAAGTESDGEGLLDYAMDSLRRKTADLVPSFRPGRARARAAPKPLRLKLAEQVLSKELLSAVQLVEGEIIQSADPLPSATIKFFLKAGTSMGTGWARQNATRIFVFLSGYVAATCGVMHGVKAAAKWLAWRIPRIGKRAVGPAVSFTADVLLPTSFFGPALATYVLVLIIIKPKSPKPGGDEGDTTAATGSNAAAAADGVTGDKQLQQQQVQVTTRSLSQLEFVVDEPAGQRRLNQWRSRRPLVHTSSLRGRVRQAVKARSTIAAAAPQGSGAEAEAEADAAMSAAVISESSQEE